MTCIFCDGIPETSIIYQTENFKVVFDIDPIQTGHLLIISKQHYDTLSQMPSRIRYELSDLEVFLAEQLCQQLNLDGITLACNDRLFDDGTHFHVHLIPRFQTDGFWDNITLSPVQIDLTPFLKSL